MAGAPRGSVILLHDQLQDARIWGALLDQLTVDADVRTVAAPPLRTLGRPGLWADHIERSARTAVPPGGVDLAVTVGGAGEAGVALTGDGRARRALLLDPDPKVAIDERTARDLLREPDVSDRLAEFFAKLDPERLMEFATHGTLPAQQVVALVDASLANAGELPEAGRRLLRQVAVDQLTAALPLDLPARRRPPSDRPDWIDRMRPVAARCTVALTPGRFTGRLAEALAVRTPATTVVRLTGTAAAWVTAPRELTHLIHTELDHSRQDSH